jgi:hypothetical protein|tara:strand:- start:1048 stop:1224 length:177 start_codon:yes stop_codon:yes gene_type:complete
MSKIYTLKNTLDGSVVKWTLPEILEEINRDRSDEWSDYDEWDWKEGLDTFTEYELVQE